MVLCRWEILQAASRELEVVRKGIVSSARDHLRLDQDRREESLLEAATLSAMKPRLPEAKVEYAFPPLKEAVDDSFDFERIDEEEPEIDESLFSRILNQNARLKIQNLDQRNVELAGMDFRVGEEIYIGDSLRQRVYGLPHLRELAKRGILRRVSTKDKKVILEPDVEGKRVYYIASVEKVKLAKNLDLIVDSKSTTGRTATLCLDCSREVIERGFMSPVITTVQPYAFPIVVKIGETCLAQAALRFKGSEYMGRDELLKTEKLGLFRGEEKLNMGENGRVIERGVLLTYSTKRALRAKTIDQIPVPIEMDARGKYDVSDYFDLIEGDGEIELEQNRFYLLGTEEGVSLGGVCGMISRATLEASDLWSHFAGFIWPGFIGRITMECRTPVKRVISRGEKAAYVQFDELIGRPPQELMYHGEYQHQDAPMAPKMFKLLAR